MTFVTLTKFFVKFSEWFRTDCNTNCFHFNSWQLSRMKQLFAILQRLSYKTNIQMISRKYFAKTLSRLQLSNRYLMRIGTWLKFGIYTHTNFCIMQEFLSPMLSIKNTTILKLLRLTVHEQRQYINSQLQATFTYFFLSLSSNFHLFLSIFINHFQNFKLLRGRRSTNLEIYGCNENLV